MDADALVRKWGARKLEIAGYENVDPDTVTVDFGLESDGYCETCWYEFPAVTITSLDGAWLVESYPSLPTILREMLELDSGED